MKQISTGAGLLGLGVCMVATAFIATHRGSSEAFAQVTGGERRIVAQGVYLGTQFGDPTGETIGDAHWGYRVWSDNTTEVKYLGSTRISPIDPVTGRYPIVIQPVGIHTSNWQVVDTGTGAFLAADVDRSLQVDAGDISSVLLDFSASTDETPPPPIDCNINAPR